MHDKRTYAHSFRRWMENKKPLAGLTHVKPSWAVRNRARSRVELDTPAFPTRATAVGVSHFDLAKYNPPLVTTESSLVKRNERWMGSLGQTSTSMDHRRFLWWRVVRLRSEGSYEASRRGGEERTRRHMRVSSGPGRSGTAAKAIIPYLVGLALLSAQPVCIFFSCFSD